MFVNVCACACVSVLVWYRVCVYCNDMRVCMLVTSIHHNRFFPSFFSSLFTAQQNQPIAGGREGGVVCSIQIVLQHQTAVNIGVYICTHLTDKQLVLLGLRSERLCGVNNEFPLLQIAAMCFNTIRRTELFRVL